MRRLARRVVHARRSSFVCCAVAIFAILAAGLWNSRAARSGAQFTGRQWRIGFHDTEPFVYRGPDGKAAGFAKDVLTEAARSSAIQLEWVYVPQGALSAFQTGLIDLFPRSSSVAGMGRAAYITDPWFESSYGLVELGAPGSPIPINLAPTRVATGPAPFARVFAGRSLPGAVILRKKNWKAVLDSICAGEVQAGFAEIRDATSVLLAQRSICQDQALRVLPLPNALLQAGIGSTSAAKGVADHLRQRIDAMAESGRLAEIYGMWYQAAPNEIGLVELLRSKRRQRVLLAFSVVLFGLFLATAGLAWRMRRLREEAHCASQAKSRFMATMSHEIRTPLNGVIGMAGLLLGSHLGREQHEMAKTVRSSAEDLLAILNDILDISKIEAGGIVIEPAPFDLSAAAEDVVRLLAPRAREKGLELVLRCPPGQQRYLLGDVGRVRQVLANLVGNAIKFTDSGHVIVEIDVAKRDVAADGPQHWICFAVHDTGIGIPLAKQHLLFQEFSQADSSTTRRFGGTGLGLAISKRLVNRMGGEIGVTSGSGRGSTFWFRLPLPEHGDAPRPEGPDLSAARVLIVDDHEAARSALADLTTAWGISTKCVSSGREALGCLAEAVAGGAPFDVVLTDDRMPEMDGAALGHAITADGSLGHPGLVLLASSIASADHDPVGAQAFAARLLKPVPRAQLRRTLAAFVVAENGEHGDGVGEWETPARASKSASQAPTWSVLLAEDNTVNQRIASKLLEKLGCRVDLAANGREALAMWQARPYDVIFMDCQMPEMDGYEATRAMRHAESGRRTPVIALTANAMPGDRESCLNAGMDAYIAKPIKAAELAAALSRWAPATDRA